MVVLTELLTSHAFKITREVARETSDDGAGKGYIFSNLLCNLGVFAILFLIGSLCLWCYIIAGFFGIACGAVGLLSAPIIYLAISISSTIVT
jgi:Na+/H+-translocating membrane pyrophosphatase